ncbi:MAG: rod shape-determining protein RodA [Oscillospiraceae bacterium]|jgi:rod shape determining protein RodA|nr:rod shape-determining protein RodA [Oscillospiraceae bacterium]
MEIVKRVLFTIRNYFKTADSLLLALCAVATAFGLIMIYSATRTIDGADGLMRVHLAAAIIGFVAFFMLSVIDIDILTDHWPILLLFNIAFICTLFVWGIEDDTGNRAWLRFGGVGIQPSEVVKVTFTLLLAKQLTYQRESSRGGINSVLSVGSSLLHFGLITGLIIIASNDLGSALIFAFIFIVMLFAAGLRFLWFALGAIIIGAASPLIWSNFLSPYHRDRIIALFDPMSVDPTGRGITWQVNQSKIALASGKLFGQGLLNGTQSQSANIPFKHTDFIFAVVGEELGIIGCISVIVLLLAIVARCVYVGIKSRDRMKMLYCIGTAAMMTFQMFENIGMCLGLTPVIGLTLPFFSYGGSSILSTIAAMGIVSSIRRSTAT